MTSRDEGRIGQVAGKFSFKRPDDSGYDTVEVTLPLAVDPAAPAAALVAQALDVYDELRHQALDRYGPAPVAPPDPLQFRCRRQGTNGRDWLGVTYGQMAEDLDGYRLLRWIAFSERAAADEAEAARAVVAMVEDGSLPDPRAAHPAVPAAARPWSGQRHQPDDEDVPFIG